MVTTKVILLELTKCNIKYSIENKKNQWHIFINYFSYRSENIMK